MKNHLVQFSLFAALAALAACGSKDSGSADNASSGPGAKPSAPSGTMQLEDAKDIAASGGPASQLNAGLNPFVRAETDQSAPPTVVSLIGGYVNGLQPHLAVMGRLIEEQSFCEPSVEGDKTDADKDEIPVSATQVYSCPEKDYSAQTGGLFKIKLAVNGSVVASDDDDAIAFPAKGGSWEFKNFNYKFSLSFGEGSMQSFTMDTDSTMNGTQKISVSDDKKSTLEVAMRSAVKSSASGSAPVAGQSDSTTESNEGDTTTDQWMTVVATPDDAAAPDKSGGLNIEGFMGLAGSKNFVLSVSAADLKYGGCVTTPVVGNDEPPFFKSGTISYKDASDNILKFVWTNCETTPKAYFNDTAI